MPRNPNRVRKVRHVVHAVHTSRVNPDGQPARKIFPLATWNLIPGIKKAENGSKVEMSRGGWIQDTNPTLDNAPEPLKTKRVKTTTNVVNTSPTATPSTDEVAVVEAPISE